MIEEDRISEERPEEIESIDKGLEEVDGDPCSEEKGVQESRENLRREGSMSEDEISSVDAQTADTDPGVLRTELEETKSALLRNRADLDNFRKRVKREQEEWSDRVAMALLGEFLPVMDNFERAVSTRGTADLESFSQGVEMILRQMSDVLESRGVKRMSVEGVVFDPRVHEAVSVVESDEVCEEICSAEVIPGYTYKYKVLRPAKVQVTKPKATGDAASSGGEPALQEIPPVKGMGWRELLQAVGNEKEADPGLFEGVEETNGSDSEE